MSNATRIPLAELGRVIRSPIDLFLCCASYEQRSVVASRALSSELSRRSVIFFNQEYKGESRQQLEALRKHWEGVYEQVALEIQSPLSSADAFVSVLQRAIKDTESPSVVVDTTTFTRESLVILIKVLSEFSSQLGSVSLIYSLAETMAEDWLSRGVREIRPILGYPGLPSPSKSLHLVVLTGFETERARVVIDEYEPEIISIGCGAKGSSISPSFHARNQGFVDNLVGLYGDRVRQFEFSLLDPISTMHSLESHLGDYAEYNIVISAMNNKISTIGAAFAGIAHEEYQLCYAQAASYNVVSYSTPSNEAIVVDIDWSDICLQS